MKITSKFKTVFLTEKDEVTCRCASMMLDVEVQDSLRLHDWISLLGLSKVYNPDYEMAQYVVYEDGTAECLTESIDEDGFPIDKCADYSREKNQLIFITKTANPVRMLTGVDTISGLHIGITGENSLGLSVTF